MRPQHRTWRVRGVPADIDETKLADILLHHPDLRCPNDSAANNLMGASDNGVEVHTLASDLSSDQVATIRFQNLPTQLENLERKCQLPLDVQASSRDIHISSNRKRDPFPTFKLTIDEHFDGITILASPSHLQHDIDVLAISGLGSHPFGSFTHKQDGHMWLSDSLPRDMPCARVLLYGYQSELHHSNSFAHLGDYAGSLRSALRQLLQSQGRKPLILLGHSLGGLLIKEALIQIAESESGLELIRHIAGVAFFGVPNDGLDIESLVPMVNGQPNRFFLESLGVNSQVLDTQRRNFSGLLDRIDLELFCFYETEYSPTAVKVDVSETVGVLLLM